MVTYIHLLVLVTVPLCTMRYIGVWRGVHWPKSTRELNLRFHLSLEKISSLAWPRGMEVYANVDCNNALLDVVGGCMSASCWHGADVEIQVTKKYDMEESCWTRMLKIRSYNNIIYKVITLTKDGRKLLSAKSSSYGKNYTRFCWFNINTNKKIGETEMRNSRKERIYDVKINRQTKLTLMM